MYRLDSEIELTEEILARFINTHKKEKRERYTKLKKAYEGVYNINYAQKKPKFKPDVRNSANFAKYITDILQGYTIGKPARINSEDKTVDSNLIKINSYISSDTLNFDIVHETIMYGKAYEMLYIDESAEICSCLSSVLDSFLITDNSVLKRPRYFVRLWRNYYNKEFGSISDDKTVKYFKLEGGTFEWLGEPKLHSFDGVPVAEYTLNSNAQSVFESVLNLINNYNLALSEKGNDVSYFADAYLKILGPKLDEESAQGVRDNKILNFKTQDARNLDVGFMTKPSADETQENYLDRLERLIFQLSMVPNINDANFASQSGIALEYKLQSLDYLAQTLKARIIKGLERRYKLICSSPLSDFGSEDWTKINYTFTRNLPLDIASEIANARNAEGVVSDETKLSLLSFVGSPKQELEKIKKEEEEKVKDLDLNNYIL